MLKAIQDQWRRYRWRFPLAILAVAIWFGACITAMWVIAIALEGAPGA